MKAYMFPGQGSQQKGMGGDLFDSFNEVTKEADEVLKYSIKELCLNDPYDQLHLTKYTQVALFIVNYLHYLEYSNTHPGKVDYLIGHSLGEYNALHLADVVDFKTALKIVQKRGELMSTVQNGAMAAVIKCPMNMIQKILQDNQLNSIDIANYNSHEQIVISGQKDEIFQAKTLFEAAKAIYIPLKVSAAFHSKHMQSAAKEFAEFIKEIEFSTPKIPVISNVTGKPYQGNTFYQLLSQQISSCVQWTDSILYLLREGVVEFKEIGPGKVLTNLLKSIQSVPPIIEKENPNSNKITGETLGSESFKKCYNVRYAYIAGAMAKGIASREMVVKMANSAMMSYYGTGGVSIDLIEKDIVYIQNNIAKGSSFGMNLLCKLNNVESELELIDLFLKYRIDKIEAAAYIQLNQAIVKYRASGLSKDSHGNVLIKHRILAKISRPEVAEVFLRPAPAKLLDELLQSGHITQEQAILAAQVPIADDICVEADSGGHTDMGNMMVLLPSIIRLKDKICREYHYLESVRVGAAGGIGTPESAAAAFILGADFILTGSINQCTVEAGTSDVVKEMLSKMDVQDTEYAPAGDMFEIGAKVQVLKRGVFFPGRANKLYDLWQHHESWESIDLSTRQQIEEKYFGKTFLEVYEETKQYFLRTNPSQIEKAEKNTKHKLALVFRWYFMHSIRLARAGNAEEKINYQVHTGPAMGAFNRWVEQTELSDWRNRHVDTIGEKLMNETAHLLKIQFAKIYQH